MEKENNDILVLKNIKKNFENTDVLKGISLNIKAGEFITFLGSSGCGKTTTLRIIAGLLEPTSGAVELSGNDVTYLAPNKRDLNTVFQNYALFPHMNVEENIGYGQKLKKVHKKEIKKRVEDVLKLVQLSGYEKRMPNQLSGGQSQRVAIARAVINRPKVLLLDEPLGALDLQLRKQMQIELKELQRTLGITFIYVTHDQEEALNMSDRIVVMREGLIEQIGTPENIYSFPKTSYVAEFIGESNIIRGSVTEIKDDCAIFKNENGFGQFDLSKSAENKNTKLIKIGEKITVAVRGENLILDSDVSNLKADSCFKGVVTNKRFSSGLLNVTVKLSNGDKVVAHVHGINYPIKVDDAVCVKWEKNNAVVVDLEG